VNVKLEAPTRLGSWRESTPLIPGYGWLSLFLENAAEGERGTGDITRGVLERASRLDAGREGVLARDTTNSESPVRICRSLSAVV
jgi:hypothetical protein